MQERECDFSWKERFLRPERSITEESCRWNTASLVERIPQRLLEDVNAFGLKPPEMISAGAWRKVRLSRISGP